MEGFIREDTIVEDAIYLSFKDSVICPICSNILINPVMCMKCQNVYCRKCIDEWSKKDNKCPNRCENPNYQRSLEKNNILSKLKFKCENCGEEVFYEKVKNHMDECNINGNKVTKKRLKKLKIGEIEKLRKKVKPIRINSK
jgi:hypothetical protein